ncbi:hypothetical protein MKW94_021885 [Papaver nudicaule]|uniref:Uncharacterized protein n=1 Tax=Papaver nudicaule TaxID=74823 RepID=A0AA41SD97_PAPNU|nr:hypothetical protein [Papaver nudicaule]
MESKKFMSLFLIVVVILSIFFASADAACMSKGSGCGGFTFQTCCAPLWCSYSGPYWAGGTCKL